MSSVGCLPRRQRGMSFPQIVMLILIVGFVVVTAFSLVPIYLESFSVGTSLDGAREAAMSEPETPSPGRLRTLVERRLSVNEAQGLAEELQVYEERNVWVMEIAYERRVDWFGNIDLVVSFDKRAEVERR